MLAQAISFPDFQAFLAHTWLSPVQGWKVINSFCISGLFSHKDSLCILSWGLPWTHQQKQFWQRRGKTLGHSLLPSLNCSLQKNEISKCLWICQEALFVWIEFRCLDYREGGKPFGSVKWKEILPLPVTWLCRQIWMQIELHLPRSKSFVQFLQMSLSHLVFSSWIFPKDTQSILLACILCRLSTPRSRACYTLCLLRQAGKLAGGAGQATRKGRKHS